MRGDAHPLPKHKDDVCTQQVLQEVGRALLAAGGGVGHHNERGRWLGGQERRLQQGLLHIAEVGLSELQVPAGDKRCPDGVVEHILDTELRHHARLVVGDTHLFGHLLALLQGKDLIGLDGLARSRREAKFMSVAEELGAGRCIPPILCVFHLTGGIPAEDLGLSPVLALLISTPFLLCLARSLLLPGSPPLSMGGLGDLPGSK